MNISNEALARIRSGEEVTVTVPAHTYKAQSARDAQAGQYGDKGYWDYLEQSAQEHYEHFIGKGDKATAESYFTRSLSESLAGNDGI